MIISMFEDFTFEFTPDKFIICAMGSDNSSTYTVISSSEYSKKIEADGEPTTINIINADEIEMCIDDQNFVLVKNYQY